MDNEINKLTLEDVDNKLLHIGKVIESVEAYLKNHISTLSDQIISVEQRLEKVEERLVRLDRKLDVFGFLQ